jgi:membrane protease YdiL (CAAX protease family)
MPGASPTAGGIHSRAGPQSSLPFFLLVFALSVPFWAIGAVIDFQPMPGLPIAALTFVCPAVAALILTYRERRTAGVVALLRRLIDGGRIPRLWYFPIVLLMPGVTAASFVVLRWTGVAVPTPQIAVLPAMGLFLAFMVGALSEELGWTAFALDRLQTRWGMLQSGLLLGGVWAVWHWVALTQAHRSPAWIAWWSLGTVSARIIMVWLYNRTGRSVFGVVVLHAVSNVCWQLFPVQGSFFDPRVNTLMLALMATVLILRGSWRARYRLS